MNEQPELPFGEAEGERAEREALDRLRFDAALRQTAALIEPEALCRRLLEDAVAAQADLAALVAACRSGFLRVPSCSPDTAREEHRETPVVQDTAHAVLVSSSSFLDDDVDVKKKKQEQERDRAVSIEVAGQILRILNELRLGCRTVMEDRKIDLAAYCLIARRRNWADWLDGGLAAVKKAEPRNMFQYLRGVLANRLGALGEGGAGPHEAKDRLDAMVAELRDDALDAVLLLNRKLAERAAEKPKEPQT